MSNLFGSNCDGLTQCVHTSMILLPATIYFEKIMQKKPFSCFLPSTFLGHPILVFKILHDSL